MSWTQRQQVLLRGMGLQVWTKPAEDELLDLASPVAADTDDRATLVATQATPPTTPAKALDSSRQRPTAGPINKPGARPESNADAKAKAPPAPTAARPITLPNAAGLDWPALRQTVAQCHACGLCESRQQTVLGSGPAQAHWMLVGDAPGAEEDQQGLPFVGPPGQLLDRMLAALQVTRSADDDVQFPPTHRAYTTNTVKCRPPGNRNPTPEEMAACAPYLTRQIELQKPRIIVALGPVAAKALLRSDAPLGKLRGQVHQYQGVPVVVTYHPAYLQRQPREKAKAWMDWCLAADTVLGA